MFEKIMIVTIIALWIAMLITLLAGLVNIVSHFLFSLV